MSRELFARDKRAGCLSNWQVSQVSMGSGDASVTDHLEVCAECRARVDDEYNELEAAADERLPAALLARAGTPPIWKRLRPPPKAAVLAVAGLAALLAAGALVRSLRKPASPPPVVATVTRDGRVLVHDVPPGRTGKLRAGDKLRLRVQDTNVRWVRLLAQQGGTLWDVYYEGPVPGDGWLPAGFTVTPLSRMQLRLLACPEEPASGAPAVPAGCFTEQFDL